MVDISAGSPFEWRVNLGSLNTRIQSIVFGLVQAGAYTIGGNIEVAVDGETTPVSQRSSSSSGRPVAYAPNGSRLPVENDTGRRQFARCVFPAAQVANFGAVSLVHFYRHKGTWKCRMDGNGFKNTYTKLAGVSFIELYGISITAFHP